MANDPSERAPKPPIVPPGPAVYIFQPVADITTVELAIVVARLAVVVSQAGFDGFPIIARRHFMELPPAPDKLPVPTVPTDGGVH